MKIKKVACPKCEGKGWYDYHWQECSNAQIDEWVKEDCRECNMTGTIEIDVPVNIFKKYHIKTQKELESTLNSKKIYKKNNIKENKQYAEEIAELNKALNFRKSDNRP